MSRWPVVDLGAIAEVISGQSPPGETYNEEGNGLPFFQGKAEFGEVSPTARKWCTSPIKIAQQDDILISVRAPVGPTNIAAVQCCIGRGLAAIRINPDRADRDFVLWQLRAAEPSLAQKSQGSTFAAINRNDLVQLPIPLPPLTEQRRIVDLLNHAAGIRRLRQQALETARALIPALFVKMFGDPARNEKGWEVVELGNLVVDGPQNGLYKHASAYGEGTPILRIDAFYDGVVTDIRALRRLQLTADEIERYGLAENDIVINRVNSPEYLGKTAIIPALPEPTVFESNMMRFSVDPKVVDQRFLIQYLQTGFIKQQILGRAKHAINQSSINQQDVKSFPVLVPPVQLQQTFAARVADLQAITIQQERHLALAEALLQSLMARFFGGSLECGDTSPLYQSADMSAHSKEPIENAVVPAHSKTTPRRRFDSADISVHSQIAAEAPAVYTAGGQAALPAANQPVPARILSAMQPGRDYSRAELLAATGISEADWTGAIRQLKEEGKVRQAGEKRGARYRRA